MLWAASDTHRLSRRARSTLNDAATRPWLSAVTGFEIATKVAIGKLRLDLPAGEFIAEGSRSLGAAVLPVTMEHALGVSDLPMHHRDPFDRLLVAQARSEGLAILTADRVFARYDVEVIW